MYKSIVSDLIKALIHLKVQVAYSGQGGMCQTEEANCRLIKRLFKHMCITGNIRILLKIEIILELGLK